MNLLWIVNTVFPAASKASGRPAPVTGGWMYGLASQVAAQPGVRLAVATTVLSKDLKIYDIDGIRYYLLPVKSSTTYQKHLEPIWQDICGQLAPDVVHIHGTEFPHGLACMRACPQLNYVVSVQGLVSVYSRYYLAGIRPGEILTHITFRDILRCDTIFQGRKTFAKRGEFEKESLRRTRHVIGRTSWDYAHTRAVNPAVAYHFCNESLRDGFYSAVKWDAADKSDYTIFLSQAKYPIKGLHQMLKAAVMLKRDFPKIQIRIAGASVIRNRTLSEKIRLSGYGSYLRGLIESCGLRDNVRFLDSLDEQRMIDEYRTAHVFVCPSSIENSPNSLGEAQILGTPSVAAYVGGVPDMVVHEETGLLYRFEEVEMLAGHIRRVFTDEALARKLSSNGIAAAEQRHDRQRNLDRTLSIYGEISSGKSHSDIANPDVYLDRT